MPRNKLTIYKILYYRWIYGLKFKMYDQLPDNIKNSLKIYKY